MGALPLPRAELRGPLAVSVMLFFPLPSGSNIRTPQAASPPSGLIKFSTAPGCMCRPLLTSVCRALGLLVLGPQHRDLGLEVLESRRKPGRPTRTAGRRPRPARGAGRVSPVRLRASAARPGRWPAPLLDPLGEHGERPSVTGRPWQALRTPPTTFSRLNGSVAPLRLTTMRAARLHRGEPASAFRALRRRRIEVPSSVVRGVDDPAVRVTAEGAVHVFRPPSGAVAAYGPAGRDG